jgi:hypothetical protein
MLAVAFACFAILMLAWVMAPGQPIALGDLLKRQLPANTAPGDIELQH